MFGKMCIMKKMIKENCVSDLTCQTTVHIIYHTAWQWSLLKVILFLAHLFYYLLFFNKRILSQILHFCRWFKTKDAAEPRQLLRLMQCWFLLTLLPKEFGQQFLFFLICAFAYEI